MDKDLIEQRYWDSLTNAEKAEIEALETPWLDPLDVPFPLKSLGKTGSQLVYKTVQCFGKKRAGDILFKRVIPNLFFNEDDLFLTKEEYDDLKAYFEIEDDALKREINLRFETNFLLELYFDLRRRMGTHERVLHFLESVRVLSEEGAMMTIEELMELF